ncbi:MAG: MATE family efflux transporter [Eubacteriales bacterium]
MGIPSMAAQLVNLLYNIVDRIYIGHIEGYGDVALTGIGVTFPIITLITAFTSFAGSGGAPIAAMELGKKNAKGAEKVVGTSVAMLLTFAVTLTLFFQIFKTPILYAFGASDATIGYASDYITIYLMGTIFVQLAIGLNPYISAQGNSKIAMLSVFIGAGINIILDPILIFGFGLGVQGAAIATIVSQACSALWVVKFLSSKKSLILLQRKNIRLKKSMVQKIASLGISPFIMGSTESLVTITLNSGLQKYGGDVYVGSMSILLSCMQIVMVPTQGLSSGIQPILSYNYGAGNRERVVGGIKRLLILCIGFIMSISSIALFAPQVLVGLFTSNQELFDLTVEMMPIFFTGTFTIGILMGCQGTFLALGQARISLTIALLRKVILLVPLAIILPNFFGVRGIYYAEPIADISASIIAATLFVIFIRKILQNCGGNGKIK